MPSCPGLQSRQFPDVLFHNMQLNAKASSLKPTEGIRRELRNWTQISSMAFLCCSWPDGLVPCAMRRMIDYKHRTTQLTELSGRAVSLELSPYPHHITCEFQHSEQDWNSGTVSGGTVLGFTASPEIGAAPTEDSSLCESQPSSPHGRQQ